MMRIDNEIRMGPASDRAWITEFARAEHKDNFQSRGNCDTNNNNDNERNSSNGSNGTVICVIVCGGVP